MALLLSKKPLGKKIVTVFAFICKQRLEYGYGSGSIFICQVNIVLMDTYELKDIDVGFDFTSDTAHYWDGFWKEDDLGWSRIRTQKVQLLGGIISFFGVAGFLVGKACS